jgi:phage virion morphogenesis protein
VSVTQTGASEVGARLAGVAARLRDLTPITSVIAADTMTVIDDAFRDERAPDGTSWQQLAPSTVASRRGTAPRILTDTGRLRSSNSARGTRNGLLFGTNVAYGRPHQTGGRRLAKRAFLPVDIDGSSWKLMDRGPAGEHWRRARDSIRHYITTGEVT